MSSPSHPVDCTIDFSTTNLAGKTAIVTGGANGLGEAYVRALASADVAVCIADMNASAGEKLASELPKAKFIQCDVTKWEDQRRLFEEAAAFSPTGRINYVITNAGIAAKDEVFAYDGEETGPQEPNLKTIDVNLKGVLYTVKLALHYFVKQNGSEQHSSQEDQCLVLISSGAGYFDVPRGVQYSSTKWAARGIMHGMRKAMYHCGSRVNIIAPWYVKTNILPAEVFERVRADGVEFATAEDGGECLLRILSDGEINGKCLFISARKWAPRGYIDLDVDDYRDSALMEEIQADQVRSAPPELGLFLDPHA